MLGVLISAGVGACLYPDDRSGELEVQMIQLPTLFLKDSLRLQGRVLDGNGDPVANAVIEYRSDDPTIVAVDAEGILRAVAVGTTQVTATAVEYSAAEAVTQTAIVRGLLEVDSVVPLTARFGEFVDIYGVGLDTADLFTVTVDGFEAQVSSFTPLDPEKPNEFGRLTVWMPPPAERRSTMTVLGINGGVVFPESLTVIQRDIFEPNDTSAAHLGDIPVAFGNPALAFEVVPRDGSVRAPSDWYTFTNAVQQDRTLIVFSEVVGAETYRVFITDSLDYDGNAPADVTPFTIGPNSWTIGPETYFCEGLPLWNLVTGEEFSPAELPFPFTLVALKDLPAGTFHVLAPYEPAGDPARYEMAIGTGYLSVIAQDAAEENDYCNVAADLNSFSGSTLTIDNFRDVEWFRFSVGAGGASVTINTSSQHEDSDLDLYVIADLSAIGLLPVVGAGVGFGQDESVTLDSLPTADYYLLIIDFPGVPTQYTLNATFGPATSGGPDGAALAAEPYAALAAKREQARAGRAGLPRPRPHR